MKIFFYKILLKSKEKFQKEACERYQNLYEEEKDKWQKKVWDRYQNLSDEEKEKKALVSSWK